MLLSRLHLLRITCQGHTAKKAVPTIESVFFFPTNKEAEKISFSTKKKTNTVAIPEIAGRSLSFTIPVPKSLTDIILR